MLLIRRSLLALVGRNQTVVRNQFCSQKPPGSRLLFSHTGVQHSPGSSTIELPSAFAKTGAYPPYRALSCSPRQCSLPFACRHASRRTPNRSADLGTSSSTNHTAAASQRTGEIAKAASWLNFSRVIPSLHSPKIPYHTHTTKPGFIGRGHVHNS